MVREDEPFYGLTTFSFVNSPRSRLPSLCSTWPFLPIAKRWQQTAPKTASVSFGGRGWRKYILKNSWPHLAACVTLLDEQMIHSISSSAHQRLGQTEGIPV